MLLGLYMVVDPVTVVRMFERMAEQSNGAFANRNRRTFDPAHRTQNAQITRLVGIGWLVVAAVGGLSAWVNH